MPMYNLLEYIDNYSMKSGSLWDSHRDEINNDVIENDYDNRWNNNKIITSKSFEYKTKLIWSTPNNNNMLHTEIVAPLKYLNNISKSIDLVLINCQIELNLKWTKYCIIS